MGQQITAKNKQINLCKHERTSEEVLTKGFYSSVLKETVRRRLNVLKGAEQNTQLLPLFKFYYLYLVPRRLFKQVKARVCITLPVCTLGNIRAAGTEVSDQTQVKVRVRNKSSFFSVWAVFELF